MNKEYEEAVLCGFVWCHGEKDFSAWEVELTKQDQEAIEKILSKYETNGTSERNCYGSKFSDLFGYSYQNLTCKPHWTDYLPADVYERLCECQNRKKDLPILVNARWLWLHEKYGDRFEKEDAVIYVLELMDCNSQENITDLTSDEYNELCK